MNENCLKATKIKDKDSGCRFYHGNINHHENLRKKLSNKILDIEELRDLGTENNFCPYFF